MSRFFKFLIMVAAIANLILLLVFEDQIPTNLPIPFLTKPAGEEVVAEETVEEETVMPVQTEEVTEPETETDKEAEVLPEEVVAAEEPEEEETEEEQALPECRIISLDGSNIRSGPGLENEVVASFPYDTVLVLTGEYEIGWYSILAEDGTEGYIFETQIELPEGYVTEETEY